jgi:histidyl-tRNA synthetase
MSDETGAARAPSGTHDVLWPESTRWETVLATFSSQVEAAGYGLAHTPIFEDVRVFRRGIGEGSDVVGKEMYEFQDRGGRTLALRPEGTAPVVRAFVQHRPPLPWKAWYATPAFRYERPQAGRYRQHHQLGVEALGPADPDLDVEVIVLADDFFRSLGLGSFTLRLNSMGDAVCRPGYLDLLTSYLTQHRNELCPEHAERMEDNPLRVLDCKRPACRAVTAGAPSLADHLCEPCRLHFARVRTGLTALGVPYELDHRLVRGFDYYTRTTFEFASAALEAAQNGIGGGGRYDGLVEMLGGPPTPGIGFGIGIERLLLACDAEGVFPVAPEALDAFVVDVDGGESARDLTAVLRRAGLRADRAFDGRSIKSQLRSADRSGARVALIVGPDEVSAGTVSLRPLRGTGEQRTVARSSVVEAVREESGR